MALFQEDQQVQHLSQQLVQAVEVILDPVSTQERRKKAYEFCEDFKNTSVHLSNCGIYLYNTSFSPTIKHFGLQLVQHAVKLRWNNLSPDEKLNLKTTSLQFIANEDSSLLEKTTYIKDGIAKLVVEIIKREWPQQWPDLFKNLSDISQKGISPLYIVMRVLLRLAEEVTNNDSNLPPVRRKEMTTALTEIMEELFNFFSTTLQTSVNKIKEMKSRFGNNEQKEVLLHKVICESVLSTMSGYVGWVNTNIIVQNNASLLEMLCLLLQDEQLNLAAADCLEVIASRKGKVIERQPLLILFNVDAIRIMFSCATSVTGEEPTEERRIFLKRVYNILSLIGSTQLATIWGTDGVDQGEPPHFDVYIEALLTLYQQRELLIIDAIDKVWLAFLKNEDIAKNTTFQKFLPNILNIAKTKMTKESHPSNKDLSSRFYSEIDFGTTAEKQALWTIVRSNTREIVQEITSLFPGETFLQAASLLLARVHSSQPQVQVTETSEEYFKWDSMMFFLNSVCVRLFNSSKIPVEKIMSSIIMVDSTTMTVCQLGQKCIQALIQFQTTDLVIKPIALACFENLMHFITFAPDMLKPVIQSILQDVSFVSSKPNERGAALDFRRHAATIWIRLCLLHSKLMIDLIEELSKHIHSSLVGNDFNSHERSLLVEGLVILSNEYKNYNKQRAYLTEVIVPVKTVWTTTEMGEALSSTESLIKFVGLDKNKDDTQSQRNRFVIVVCLRYMQGILKRVEIPSDSKEQVTGGFKLNMDDEPSNPAAQVLLPLLSNVFHLIRVVNNIWHPEMISNINPSYRCSLNIHDAERAAIFGLEGSEEKTIKDVKSKGHSCSAEMKSFLFKLQENCSIILSDCSRLGKDFYEAPLLSDHLTNYVINSWKHLPNYRLRHPIRNFLKHFCRHCPPRLYKGVVAPVMNAVISFIIQHLNEQWQLVGGRENISVGACVDDVLDEENGDKSEEVIENQLVHLLTRNFMETFFLVCTDRRIPNPAEGKQGYADDTLHNIAKFLLNDAETCLTVLYTPFIALRWPDSAAFIKSIKLCISFIKQFVEHPPQGVLTDSSLFKQLFILTLKGFDNMVQTAEMQTQLTRCAMIVYDTLRPLFPELKDILLQIPGAIEETINHYDRSLFANPGLNEKMKKKVFKNIINGLIRKEVGKLFSHDITILDLPSLPQKKKPSPKGILDTDVNDVTGLAQLFQP